MTLDEKPTGAAERLAEETGRPIEEFEAGDDESAPAFDELDWEEIDDDESPFSDS